MVFAWLLFLGGTLTILTAGTRLARVADELADRSGWGEAFTGALLLGGITSLPGLFASATAAAHGLPEMAVSNAAGGITVQTAFLVAADFACRRANLEHVAASPTNLFQGAWLILLLSIPLLSASGEWLETWSVHPATLVIASVYVFGFRAAAKVREEAMWIPRQTSDTLVDEPAPENMGKSFRGLIFSFALLGTVTGLAGFAVGRSGVFMVSEAGLQEALVGGIFTAISSSLPELVTTIAAVRRHAYTLAVSGIIGGNAFDTLFISVSDLFYPEGSIYHEISARQEFMLVMAIAMTAILLAGLVRRERRGPSKIGCEGILILLCYLAVVLVVTL